MQWVGVMQYGQLLEVAATEKLFTAPEHSYSKKLISLMPEFTGLKESLQPVAALG